MSFGEVPRDGKSSHWKNRRVETVRLKSVSVKEPYENYRKCAFEKHGNYTTLKSIESTLSKSMLFAF